MVEAHKNLFIGDGKYVDRFFWNTIPGEHTHSGWSLLICAKEPWHRQALGYETHGAPRYHYEYYFARRGNCLILNLVDAEIIDYIPEVVIDEGIKFISERLNDGDKVLVCCNHGESRAPGIVLLWMWENGYLAREWEDIGREFIKVYPNFRPGRGMFEFIKRRINGKRGCS